MIRRKNLAQKNLVKKFNTHFYQTRKNRPPEKSPNFNKRDKIKIISHFLTTFDALRVRLKVGDDRWLSCAKADNKTKPMNSRKWGSEPTRILCFWRRGTFFY
jgi:hypothetical protein